MRRLPGKLQKKTLFWISLTGLFAIVALLLAMSFYNHMNADDYVYAMPSIRQWRADHSVWKVLTTQFQWSLGNYYSNQGTFASEWIVSSLLVMICDHHYYLGTFLILLTMVGAEALFLMLIGVKGLGADRYTAGIVTCLCIALQLAMVPYPVEAFYWLCGAVMYTFWYALAVLLYVFFFVFLYRDERVSRRSLGAIGQILLQVGICFLSFLVGFGNYVTAIFILSSYIILLCWIWIGEKLIRERKRSILTRCLITLDSVVFLAAFLLSVLAPGNQSRLAYAVEDNITAVKAIVKSILAAAEYVCVNLHFPIFVIMLLLLPFLIQMVEARKFRFPFPVLVSVVSFGLFACQFVPNLYTLGILGAGRAQNLYRFTYYFWLFGNELYWIGYIMRCLREEQDVPVKLTGWKKSIILPVSLLEIVIMCYGFIFYGGITLTPVSACCSLYTGQARHYRAEYEERLKILYDDSIEVAYLEPFSDPPYLIYAGDIKVDPNSGDNGYVAEFYGKSSIQLTRKAVDQ